MGSKEIESVAAPLSKRINTEMGRSRLLCESVAVAGAAMTAAFVGRASIRAIRVIRVLYLQLYLAFVCEMSKRTQQIPDTTKCYRNFFAFKNTSPKIHAFSLTSV